MEGNDFSKKDSVNQDIPGTDPKDGIKNDSDHSNEKSSHQ